MMALGSLSFLFPWVLIALAALPLIWWLLRLVPPKPKTVIFPAIQFLFQLKKDEQSAATTPWWLLLLRLTITALIILAISVPILNMPQESESNGPVVIFVDDSWTASENWEAIRESLNEIVGNATRKERQIYVVPAAAAANGITNPALTALSTTEALGIAFSILPKSWPASYTRLQDLLPQLQALNEPEFIWLSSGIIPDSDQQGLIEFFEKVAALGPLTLYTQDVGTASPIIGMPKIVGETMEVPLYLPIGVPPQDGFLTARADSDQILASEPFTFSSAENEKTIALTIPNKIRNEISRLEITGGRNAGSVFLLDYRWQRREIGLIGSPSGQLNQPLLDERHYLTQALTPFFDIKIQELDELIEENVSLIALEDTGNLPQSQEQSLSEWIEKGGVLIRFAGPKLANSTSTLVPVSLRSGNRSLQGAMSWGKPASLGPVPEGSPFAILEIPDEIRVMKQVLANPSADLANKTWAQLEDGTPLVTAAQQGSGWLVLFHTTATPEWTNLPLSGLFVEMLREIGNLGQFGTEAVSQKRSLPPYSLLDGYGMLSLETGSAENLNTEQIADITLNASHPPGYYGNSDYNISLNIGQFSPAYSTLPIGSIPANIRSYEKAAVVELVPPILLAALLLIVLDQIISLFLQGKLPSFRRLSKASTASVLLVGLILGWGHQAEAQTQNLTEEERILAATLETRLGYVLTNDRTVDSMSHAGLFGLSEKIRHRTSIEAREPLPIDIEQDQLLFYPLVYWPITTELAPLSDTAILKLNDYFKGGGTILFDTRNQNTVGTFGIDPFNSPENIRLRQLLSRLDIPRLVPVPVDHVITRSFYLMQSFPGRYAGGDVWIEDTAENQGNDGVASILIGGNDWAAAWAIDNAGKPIAAVIPGSDRQRELAFRFGINLVMYTLTGNYKADQVHVPAILERLGQ